MIVTVSAICCTSLENVAGDKHRLAPPGQVPQHRADLVNASRVKPIGRLVEDQQVRGF